MRLFILILACLALLPGAARASSARHALVQAPAAGWTLPGALRALVLNNPQRTLPEGVLVKQVAAFPANSPFWKLTLQALVESDYPVNPNLTPEDGARQAIAAVLATPEEKLAQAIMGAVPADRSRGLANHMNAVLAAPELDPRRIFELYQLQSERNTARALPSYDDFLNLRGWNWRDLAPRAVFDPRSAPSLTAYAVKPSPLKAMVDDLRAQHGHVTWADVGGGFSLPQRQWSQLGWGSDVRRLLVDHFNWELLSHRIFPTIKMAFGEAVFDPRHRPKLLLSGVSTVKFSAEDRPNLITSFASIQYWRDKIADIAKLYNQLRPGGFLLIANDTGWSSLIHEQGSPMGDPSLAIDGLIGALDGAGIEMVAVTSPDSRTVFGLWARRAPDTRLVQKNRLVHTSLDGSRYTVSHYRSPRGRRAPVEVRRQVHKK